MARVISTPRVVAACAAVLLLGITGCAGVKTSNRSYNDTYKLNQHVKDEKCYDAAVLLGKDLPSTQGIANRVLAALDAKIKTDSATSIQAQRNRHIGVLAGSGGEELSLSLKSVSPQSTFVTAATKTGFVKGAGQKAWSCKIVDEMVKMTQTP